MVRRRIARWILAAILAAGILGIGSAAAWYQMFYMPCCICMDLREREIDVDMIKRIEEREKDGNLGILRIAGWRIESQKMVSAVSTGRRQTAQVICVYGSMELVEKADILSGRYGLAVEEDYCVLSEGLARQLFGNVDAAGQWIKADRRKMIVAGVIEKDGDVLMIPVKDGKVEQMAVEVKGRMGAKEKAEGLLER